MKKSPRWFLATFRGLCSKTRESERRRKRRKEAKPYLGQVSRRDSWRRRLSLMVNSSCLPVECSVDLVAQSKLHTLKSKTQLNKL